MGTIAISVDGKSIFTWEGDDSEIAKILDTFPRGAHGVGMTPDALADNAVMHLSARALAGMDSVAKEMMMMAVTWRILVADTGNPEHPGKFAEYAGAWNFDVDFQKTGKKAYRLIAVAKGRFDS